MENPTTRMRQLIERLNQASEAYYNGQRELMSDYEWDALFDQLKTLEEETGIVLPGSPTHKVSEDSIAGKKETHEFPALSLAKTKSVAELASWAGARPVWLSWKLDGLTLVVTYDNGKLTKVVTRGDGHVGTNITHLAPAIEGILPRVTAEGHLVIRGEAVISYDDFERFLLESGGDYANPRNLASGTLALKDIEEVRRRHVHWVPFTLVYTNKDINSWGERMRYLEQLGFQPVEREEITQPDNPNLQACIDRWTEKVTSGKNPYSVDGLVITYDDTAYAQTGSVTGHHATRGGMAFKWQDEAAETTLDHIEWSCAAGSISPVAVFTPVELEGTTVRRSSLCNISECRRLGIGGKGTALSVIKANKIIPKVIQVREKVGELEIPTQCPVCGAPTQITENETSLIERLQCTNPDCAAKQLSKFTRFVSKEGLDIDGISEQTLAKFINEGLVHEFPDLFHLRDHVGRIERFEGWGPKSTAKLMASIEKARDTDSRRLLYALSIPFCGVEVAKRLVASFTMEQLMEISLRDDGDEMLASVDGIGPEKSSRVVNWMRDERNRTMLLRLLGELRVKEEEKRGTGTKCAGKTFVITGDVYHYKNRNELKAYIESQGGKVTGSVSKSTHYLINNDALSTSNKNKKAHALGIPIITEEEFINRFASPETP